MREHEKRVVDELVELNAKKDKLKAFLDDDTKFKKLDQTESTLLLEQYSVMEHYSLILSKRIAHFSSDK